VVLGIGERRGARGAARHGDGPGEETVVGSDEDSVAVTDLDGDGPAGCSDTGVDHGEDDAGRQILSGPGESEAAGPDVVGRNLVGDVDDRYVGRDRPDDALDDAGELVCGPVVREERDRVVAVSQLA
jgi:hypothetical protein